MDMVGIRNKAGHRARLQQDDATTHKLNTVVRTSVRRQPHIAALFEYAFNNPNDTPTPVVVYRSPLTREPDERIQREALVGSPVDQVPRIAARVASVVLRL